MLYDWSQVPAEQLNPHVSRKAIHTAAMTIARLHIKKGGVVPEHAASARVAEKNGMKFEGTLRQNAFFKGKYQDIKIYAMLREEWEGSSKK